MALFPIGHVSLIPSHIMAANPFQQAVDSWLARLHQSGRLRVWSVVVTIFGDAIVQRGGTVSAATLQELATRLDIEPGALRTAISRLVRDGWITRLKSGRTSSYRLTASAAREGIAAAGRIYAPLPPANPSGFCLAVLPSHDPEIRERAMLQMGKSGWSVIAPNALVGPLEAQSAADTACLLAVAKTGDIPAWVIDALAPAETVAAFGELRSEANLLASALQAAPIDPLNALAARIVLIHEWRRLVLRQPSAGIAILGNNWPGEQCRTTVAGLYHSLIGASAQWLDTRPELSCHSNPSASALETERFGHRSG